MSEGQILLLGAVAGFTIFLGLPVGRLQNLSMPVRAFLNAVAAGILVFLLIEVFNHGFEPVEHAVEDGEWATLAGKGTLFAGLFALGLVGLVYYDRRGGGKRSAPLERDRGGSRGRALARDYAPAATRTRSVPKPSTMPAKRPHMSISLCPSLKPTFRSCTTT